MGCMIGPEEKGAKYEEKDPSVIKRNNQKENQRETSLSSQKNYVKYEMGFKTNKQNSFPSQKKSDEQGNKSEGIADKNKMKNQSRHNSSIINIDVDSDMEKNTEGQENSLPQNLESFSIKKKNQMKLQGFGSSNDGDLRTTQKITVVKNHSQTQETCFASESEEAKQYVFGLSVIKQVASGIEDSLGACRKISEKPNSSNQNQAKSMLQSRNTQKSQMQFSPRFQKLKLPEIKLNIQINDSQKYQN